MSDRLHSWKQTEMNSCGGAVVMVALKELGDSISLSEETEREIWHFATGGSLFVPGSFPGRLASYCARKGYDTTLLEDRPVLMSLLDSKSHLALQAGYPIPIILGEHDRHVTAASSEGVPILQAPIELRSFIRTASCSKILLLVLIPPLNLHWILLQGFDPHLNQVTVMEPYQGKNLVLPLGDFLTHLGRDYPFAGVAIQIGGKRQRQFEV